MSEANLFQHGGVRITNARAILGGKTYAMANVTSVSMVEIPAPQSSGPTITALGFGVAVLVTPFAVLALLSGSTDVFLVGAAVVAFGIFAAVYGRRGVKTPHPKYIVRIGSASGESDALMSEDREYIWKIVDAINEAIVRRG